MAGRKDELFKPFLFADQDLDDLVRDMRPPQGVLSDAVARLREGQPAEAEVVLTAAMITRPREIGPWHRLLLATAQARKGNVPAATATLRNLVAAVADSRVRLWAWTEMRRLGAPAESLQAEGAVLEVEGGNGVETLAAYADGTARYLLPTGAKVKWDKPDDRLAKTIAAVIAAATQVAPELAPGRLPGEPGAQTARVTVLTPSGPRAAETPLAGAGAGGLAPLYTAGTALLEEILTVAKW